MCTYAFSLHLPSPLLVRGYGYNFKRRYEWDLFYELLSIKQPRTMLQNIETTLQSYREMANRNTKKGPEGQGCAVWRAHSLYFYVVTNLQKTLWRIPSIQAFVILTRPSLPLWAYVIYGWPPSGGTFDSLFWKNNKNYLFWYQQELQIHFVNATKFCIT